MILAGNIVVCFGVVISLLFLVTYPIVAKSHWKRSAGLSVWLLVGSIFLTCLSVMLTNLFGVNYSGRALIRLIAFSSVPVAITYCTITMLRLQHGNYRRKFVRNGE